MSHRLVSHSGLLLSLTIGSWVLAAFLRLAVYPFSPKGIRYYRFRKI